MMTYDGSETANLLNGNLRGEVAGALRGQYFVKVLTNRNGGFPCLMGVCGQMHECGLVSSDAIIVRRARYHYARYHVYPYTEQAHLHVLSCPCSV